MKSMILAAATIAAGLALPLAAQAHDPRPHYQHGYHHAPFYAPRYAPYYAARHGYQYRGYHDYRHHKGHNKHCRHDARRGHHGQWYADQGRRGHYDGDHRRGDRD